MGNLKLVLELLSSETVRKTEGASLWFRIRHGWKKCVTNTSLM